MRSRAVLGRILIFLALSVSASTVVPGWQLGRIVDVRKHVNTTTSTWVANTPITKDDVSFTISVQTEDKLIVGFYEVSRRQGDPPKEWEKDCPVRLRIDGRSLYLHPPEGSDYKLAIMKSRKAPAMKPLSAEELARFNLPAPPPAPRETVAPPAPAPTAPNPSSSAPAAASTEGTLSVSSVPYLAEIFVDGRSMGYTPGRFFVAPGKHKLRLEKAGYVVFNQEVAVATGAETTVNASLEKKVAAR